MLLLAGILVLLIVAHELGHFLVAKLCKVRVDEFGIGYPPRAFLLGRIGATEYTLNWLPFGGFVKLFEEDGAESVYRTGARGSFANASYLSQASILVAGVLANVIMGWILFSVGLTQGMPVAISPDTPGSQVIVSAVLDGSPARLAGLTGGDVVKNVSDDAGAVAELTPEGISNFIAAHGGKEIIVSYVRQGESDILRVVPAHAVIPGVESQPAIGIQLATIIHQKLGIFPALYQGIEVTWNALRDIVASIGQLFAGLFNGEKGSVASLIGPVGLTGVVGDAAEQGYGQLLALAAFISLNLAIINILPIPALDGGRLVFVIYEAATRRRVSTALSQMLNTLGFVLIIVLMVAVTYNDIARLVS